MSSFKKYFRYFLVSFFLIMHRMRLFFFLTMSTFLKCFITGTHNLQKENKQTKNKAPPKKLRILSLILLSSKGKSFHEWMSISDRIVSLLIFLVSHQEVLCIIIYLNDTLSKDYSLIITHLDVQRAHRCLTLMLCLCFQRDLTISLVRIT